MKTLSLNQTNQVAGASISIGDLEPYRETIALTLMVAAVMLDPSLIGRIRNHPFMPILNPTIPADPTMPVISFPGQVVTPV